MSDSPDPLVGTILANHRIDRLLGRGGMGIVYHGTHTVLEGEAAIKVLPPHLSANEEVTRRFLREAQSAFKLRHPNVVGVHDAGISPEGAVYIVMDYCPGGSLRDRLHYGSLSFDAALPIFRALLAALVYAHEQGFIHRDIKPANVMFDARGVTRLGDFGLARLSDNSTQLTAAGQILGTPAYMPIEQWNADPLDARADQYALGVLFYETLTKRIPVEADKPTGFVTRLVTGDRVPFGHREFQAPKTLAAVIDRMTAVARDARYPDLAEVSQDLERVARGETPQGLLEELASASDVPVPEATPEAYAMAEELMRAPWPPPPKPPITRSTPPPVPGTPPTNPNVATMTAHGPAGTPAPWQQVPGHRSPVSPSPPTKPRPRMGPRGKGVQPGPVAGSNAPFSDNYTTPPSGMHHSGATSGRQSTARQSSKTNWTPVWVMGGVIALLALLGGVSSIDSSGGGGSYQPPPPRPIMPSNPAVQPATRAELQNIFVAMQEYYMESTGYSGGPPPGLTPGMTLAEFGPVIGYPSSSQNSFGAQYTLTEVTTGGFSIRATLPDGSWQTIDENGMINTGP